MSQIQNTLKVGDKAPELKLTLTRTDLVKYAGASGDFNPMHHDEILAKQAGQPSVFGHGMFSMGLIGTALTNFLGISSIKRFKVRFTKQTWPGEELVTSIEVKEINPYPDYDEVILSVALLGNGEVKVSGQAVAHVLKKR
jgi:acyl dehydratase